MAQIKYSKPQREFIEAIKQGIAKAKELKASEGYVVAGFGGDTYYCYVGDGKGFRGSCFFPMTVSAIVFNTEKEAQDHCFTGYRNGNGKGDLLDLHPVKASEFFESVRDHYQKQLDWAVDMWNKKVGRM